MTSRMNLRKVRVSMRGGWGGRSDVKISQDKLPIAI